MSAELNILIAEDEVYIALALKTILKKVLKSATFTVVNNGREALEAVNKKTFQLVISDWNMPVMTGFELLTEFRKTDAFINIPFLMLTARGDKQSVLTALNSGVTAYVAKPFENELIINKVKDLLGDKNEIEENICAESDNEQVSKQITKQKEEKETEEDEISIESLTAKLHRGEIDFPVFPVIGMKALELTKNSNVTIQELAELIHQDVSLMVKILAIANSSYYNCDHKFDLVEDAILLIGIENASNIILTISNRSLYKKIPGIVGKKLTALMEHSISTAACAKVIAIKLTLSISERIFAIGLMHDVGKLALLTVLGSYLKNRNMDSKEIDSLVDQLHVEFGSTLANHWKMTEDFIDAVSNHHNLQNKTNLSINTQIVILADLMVRRLGKSSIPYDKNDPDEPELAKLLGFNDESISEILLATQEQIKALKI